MENQLFLKHLKNQYQMSLSPSFSMSGLITLDSQQTEFLTALGLEVPAMMTQANLLNLVAGAEQIASEMSNQMIRGMTQQTIAELKASFRLE